MKRSLILALSLVAALSLNAKDLATFNGGSVTEEEVAPILQGVLMQQQHAEKLTDADKKKLQEKIVDSIISTKLVVENAKKSGITNSDEYKKALETAQNTIALQIWEKKEFDSIKVDEAKLKELYEANKNKMIVPAQVKARHILVASEKDATALIRKINAQKSSEAKLAEFDKLAKAQSADKGSAAKGGDLGWFEKAKMVPEFSKAAFAMKKGTFSTKPVKSQFGYHVIYKEDAKESAPVSYETVRPQLENQVKSAELAGRIEKKVNELREKANIKKNF